MITDSSPMTAITSSAPRARAPRRTRVGLVVLAALCVIGVLTEPRSMLALGTVAFGLAALTGAAGCFAHAVPSRVRLVRWGALTVCAGLTATLIAAVGGLIAYRAAVGTFPSPEIVRFVTTNADMMPAHVLQTAPMFTTAVTVGAALFALVLTRIAARTIPRLPLPPARLSASVSVLAFAAAGGLGAAYVRTAPSVAPSSLNPRVTAYLDSLPPRATAAPARATGFPVVVILVESLRHDLLTTYADATPFLRSLAREGITFDRAYATASHSNLTDLAFWYSQYPIRGPGREQYPRSAPWRGTSLFRAFKSAGYTTAYISSQNERWGEMINWLDTEVDHFYHSESHAGRTWENADDKDGVSAMMARGLATAGKIEDSETLQLAGAWIAKQPRNRPLFLGMNLQNTHFSYIIPPGGAEPYQPADLGFRAIYYRWPEAKAPQVRNRYLNAVVNLDRLLGEFAARLQALGVWDDCMVVVLGDNGEAFYEHGFGNHSGPMYDEAVRTVAIVKPPRRLGMVPGTVSVPISHIDIAATVAELAGVGVPASFQGQVALPGRVPARPVFMYSNAFVRQTGTVQWPWKYLVTEHPAPRVELYDLESDPAERADLSATLPQVGEQLGASLAFWREAQTRYYGEERFTMQVPPTYVPARASSAPGAPRRSR